MEKISERLRDAIRETGHSLNALAKAANVSQGILSRFMRGERTMTLDTADKLADYLDLEVTKRGREKAETESKQRRKK